MTCGTDLTTGSTFKPLIASVLAKSPPDTALIKLSPTAADAEPESADVIAI